MPQAAVEIVDALVQRLTRNMKVGNVLVVGTGRLDCGARGAQESVGESLFSSLRNECPDFFSESDMLLVRAPSSGPGGSDEVRSAGHWKRCRRRAKRLLGVIERLSWTRRWRLSMKRPRAGPWRRALIPWLSCVLGAFALLRRSYADSLCVENSQIPSVGLPPRRRMGGAHSCAQCRTRRRRDAARISSRA